MSAAAPLPEPGEHEGSTSVARSAAAQGTTIPLGWTPTPRAPVPVVRCVQIKRDGNRCARWSIRGYDKCKKHAGPGALMPDGNVNKYAQAVIEAARLRLIDSADDALDVLEDLWRNPGTSEGIKLKAATEVLDRAGIRGGIEVDVTVEEKASPKDELKRRILELKKGAEAKRRMQAGEYDDDDVIDAEVVDDEQPALFDLPTEADTSEDEHK